VATEYRPEDYTLATWLGAEAVYKGEPLDLAVDVPAPAPHPNEVATREAVKAGVYTAAAVGVPEPPKRRSPRK
jgi:hypothetical protein